MWFNKDDPLADSSGANTQHPVPPCKAAITSKAILFCRMAFLTRHISVFSKDKLCLLSSKPCWVNLVRASMCAMMSSRPMEGTKMEAKWSYQWKTERAHLALRREGWQFLLLWVDSSLGSGKPRVQQPNHMAKDMSHTTTGSRSGPPNKYPGDVTSQCQTNRYPFMRQNDHTVPAISIPCPRVHLGWFFLEWFFCSQHRVAQVLKCPQPRVPHMNPSQIWVQPPMALMVVFLGSFLPAVWWAASVVWLTEKEYSYPVLLIMGATGQGSGSYWWYQMN